MILMICRILNLRRVVYPSSFYMYIFSFPSDFTSDQQWNTLTHRYEQLRRHWYDPISISNHLTSKPSTNLQISNQIIVRMNRITSNIQQIHWNRQVFIKFINIPWHYKLRWYDRFSTEPVEHKLVTAKTRCDSLKSSLAYMKGFFHNKDDSLIKKNQLLDHSQTLSNNWKKIITTPGSNISNIVEEHNDQYEQFYEIIQMKNSTIDGTAASTPRSIKITPSKITTTDYNNVQKQQTIKVNENLAGTLPSIIIQQLYLSYPTKKTIYLARGRSTNTRPCYQSTKPNTTKYSI